MTVRYNVMNYLIGEGFRNVLKNKKSTGAALIIMCMAMLMFGVFFILGENVNYIMEQVESEQGMQVYLDIGTTDEEISTIESQIRAIGGINTVEFVSGTEGYNEMKEGLEGYADLMDGIEDIFPDSFIVTLTDLSLNADVQKQIEQIEKVDDVVSSDGTVDILIQITKGVRIVTFAILVVLVIISIFIITNTIKLTVHARRKEISIMKYVGATNGFIRTPFMIEGIIMGIAASAVSLGLVGAIYNWCTILVAQNETIQRINGFSMLQFQGLFPSLIIVFIILGA